VRPLLLLGVAAVLAGCASAPGDRGPLSAGAELKDKEGKQVGAATLIETPEGVRIAVAEKSAYELWLSRNIKHATLMRTQGIDASYDLFVNERLEVLSGLRPGEDVVVDGAFLLKAEADKARGGGEHGD